MFRLSRNKTEYMVCEFGNGRKIDESFVNMLGQEVLKKAVFKFVGSILRKGREIDEDASHGSEQVG